MGRLAQLLGARLRGVLGRSLLAGLLKFCSLTRESRPRGTESREIKDPQQEPGPAHPYYANDAFSCKAHPSILTFIV